MNPNTNTVGKEALQMGPLLVNAMGGAVNVLPNSGGRFRIVESAGDTKNWAHAEAASLRGQR